MTIVLRRSSSVSRIMKLRLLIPFFFLGVAAPLWAASDALAEVKRADAARVKATISGDATRLAALLADDLSYGHSDGRVQTKAEFISAVSNNQIKYESIDYAETKLRETAPGVVTMTGRVHLKARGGNVQVQFTLRFLAVWREEAGQWRMHAYQSTRLPEAPIAAPKSA
jgi:ketosteroid isomerase-like protein